MGGSIIITLKRSGQGKWQLYAPKGHSLSGEFRGERWQAEEWAENWVSSFNNWTVKLEDNEDEKKD